MLILESDLFDVYKAPNLFQLGGYLPMSVVTLLLVALVFAAWKAPRRVKEIGLLTLALGFFWMAIGLIIHSNLMQDEDDISSPNLVWRGLKCWLIPFAYSIIVYIISLIIGLIKKRSERSVSYWVKEIGILVLALGLLWTPVGLIRTSDLMQVTGDASLSAIWLGVKRSLIPFACSLIVYIISLIIRNILKPRD
ncbi:MAG: hypothetical protein IJQ96_04640 [Bacteroidales bacterium]|nr:hypothetical protein [Bacteroidales bacterium]